MQLLKCLCHPQEQVLEGGVLGCFPGGRAGCENWPCNQLAQARARPLQQWFFPASTSAFLFIANTLGEVL